MERSTGAKDILKRADLSLVVQLVVQEALNVLLHDDFKGWTGGWQPCWRKNATLQKPRKDAGGWSGVRCNRCTADGIRLGLSRVYRVAFRSRGGVSDE